jgi:hypothetical protein
MTAVAYLIVAGPEQTPEQSVADLLYLAQRRVLAGVSVFYPSPGSRDFQWCRDQNLLPETFMQMRATALPLVHRSDRTQTVTLLRLGRLLNFSKQVLDSGRRLPHPSHAPTVVNPGLDRQALGEILLAAFLHDNKIRGADENGTVYEHVVDHELAAAFLKGMDRIKLRGVVA